MTAFAPPWLSEEEVLFHRMKEFHRQRVEAIASGDSPLGKRDGGIIVVHLIPRSCVHDRTRFDGAKLKEHGGIVPPLGARSGSTRFNVDGLLNYEGREVVLAYSQLFRDGRLEAVMPEITYYRKRQENGVRYLRDSLCESAMFNAVGEYLRFCKAIGLDAPIHMFSALVGCEGVRICIDFDFHDASEHAIDRSPAFLPDIEIDSLDAEPKTALRPWCDTFGKPGAWSGPSASTSKATGGSGGDDLEDPTRKSPHTWPMNSGLSIFSPFTDSIRTARPSSFGTKIRYDVPTLIRDGWFELYQGLQRRPVFHGCDYIITFTGDGGTRARFLGVYRLLKQRDSSEIEVPMECPYPEWGQQSKFFYELERQEQYADLEGRVIIEWGTGALAWHQHLRNKPIIEVLPKGRALEPFTDYLDFTLTHSQLRELVAQPGAHRDWHSSLSAVSGVYLVLASVSGHQYVGSAYGLDGIWGRWSQYAASGHGGNALLRDLVEADSAYPSAFRYSVLQVLPKTTTAAEVIRWETQYKSKLGSRATGLNSN